MKEQIAETLCNATGIVPGIRNVQIVASLDQWKRANLSVAVLEDGDRCGVFIHCNEPDSLTEKQLSANITRVLSDDYFVQAENGTLVISSIPIEADDATTAKETNPGGEDRDDTGDGREPDEC